MPPLPTITDVFRVAMIHVLDHAVNVFHVSCPGGNEAQVFANLDPLIGGTSSAANPLKFLTSSDSIHRCDITKLDGSSATQSFTPTTWGGGTSGDPIPNQACIVSLRTVMRGPRGRGRLFLGPVSEGMALNGKMLTADATALAANWTTLANGLIASTPTSALVVASYKHADAHQVTTISVPTKLGSSIRRLHAA